jgi:HSP20 family protein
MANQPVSIERRAHAVSAPSDYWHSLRTEMDRMLDRFSGMAPFRHGTALTGIPAVDIVEDSSVFTLTAELPGLSDGDVQVSVSDDVLTIRGEKQQSNEEKDKNFHLTERSYGAFQRSFTLPGSINRDAITAEFANGILEIHMPKMAGAGTKSIPVKAAK